MERKHTDNREHTDFLFCSLSIELTRGSDFMTYRLNPALKRIVSPVVLLFPDGSRKEYENGESVVEDSFTMKYQIESVLAVNNRIEIKMKIADQFYVNWTGEKQTFF